MSDDPRKACLLNWDAFGKYLTEAVDQKHHAVCWAVALVNQLTAMCRMAGILGETESLSIQRLLEIVPKSQMLKDFTIKSIYSVQHPLENVGVVNATELPLTFEKGTYHNFGEDVTKYGATGVEFFSLETVGNSSEYEQLLLDSLGDAPVTVGVLVYPSMSEGKGKNLYSPDKDREKCQVDNIKGRYGGLDYEVPVLHYILATAHGVLPDGRKFIRCQESCGKDWGYNGFVDIVLGLDLIDHFVTYQAVWEFWS